MFYLVLSLHIFLCLALIVLVLLQQGKGASAGAVLGGSSNTLFGASGANTLITKVTTGFAIAFMFTSVVLIRLYSSHALSRAGDANPLQGSVMSERVAAPVGGAQDAASEPAQSEPTKADVAAVFDNHAASGTKSAETKVEPAAQGAEKKVAEKTGGKK